MRVEDGRLTAAPGEPAPLPPLESPSARGNERRRPRFLSIAPAVLVHPLTWPIHRRQGPLSRGVARPGGTLVVGRFGGCGPRGWRGGRSGRAGSLVPRS